MKHDKYGLLVSEIWPEGASGNVEDSMANTCRKGLLRPNLNEILAVKEHLITDTGYRRHPESESPESDLSWDQATPFYMFLDKNNLFHQKRKFMSRLKANKYKLNGKAYPNLLFIMVYLRSIGHRLSLFDLPLLMHALVARFFPIRWDDGKKRFNLSTGSTADYLNYTHILLRCGEQGNSLISKLCWFITPGKFLLKKITLYFKPDDGGPHEPNIDWLLEYYSKKLLK